MRIPLLLGILSLTLFFNKSSYAQCDPTVPYYQVDLSSAADTNWVLLEADALDRDGQCCSASASDNCIQFEITLNPNAAGIYFNYDGASAVGSLAWQIDCGTPYNLKDTICVSDPGPFVITFCKPGTDGGNYFIRSVAKPTFPEDQSIPLGCERPLEVLGVTASSINWTSIYPGNPGDYDTILSCTDCLDPTLTPYAGLQPYVEFAVEGYPLMDYCTGAFTYYDTVRFTFQDSIKLTIDNQNATFCSGGSAIVNASATGGDGNYTFHWYNSSLTEVYQGASFSTNIAGTYTVEVRDGNYQEGYCGGASESFTVSESYPPVVDAGADQVLCATSPDAELIGVVTYASGGIWSGGTGTYIPSNTELEIVYSPSHTELLAGSVTLTLTSTGAGGGCVNNSDDITIFFADTLKTNLSDTLMNCDYGTVNFNPVITGGVTPYTYHWGDGTTTLTNSVGEGISCLTVTDAIGCTVTDCAVVSAPPALTVSMSSVNASSNGASDGQASASPSGGTSPYSYSWSNGGTSQTEVNLSYGVYTVMVTDNNGCTVDGSVVVNEPRCLGFTASATAVDVLCNGDSTGSVTVSLSGGTTPFSYQWNDYANQTNPTASNLPAGVYTVVVADNNSCEAVATVAIAENDPIVLSMSHVDASTLGGSDGSASANVSGGSSPYSYLWNTGEATSSISSLTSATYIVDVTDNVGCLIQDSVFVSEPPCNDFVIFTSTTDALCFGSNDGTSNLNILNGVGPYSITWSSGQNNTTYVDNLSAGLYTVEVTDSRNCYTFTSFGINDPTTLSLGLLATGISCNGKTDGTIDLTVSGGTYPPYTYSWSNGKTTEDIINLGSGTYSVIVTDKNGCQANGSATISEPSALTYSYTTTDVTCYGGSDGAIDFTVNGGSLPYVYSWSNGATTQDLTGIDVGGYLLSLSDGNSCKPAGAINININEAAPVVVDTVIIDCPAQGTTTSLATVAISGGTADYQISYDNGLTYNALADYTENLTNGSSYTLMAKDVNGCLALENYTVSVDTNVYMQNFSVNYCYTSGQTTETMFITPTGGTGGTYQISTNNGISYNTVGDYNIDVPINSSYNILIRDDKHCISETYPVTLPDILSANVSVTSNYNGEDISCNGLSDGSASTTTSGGGAPYAYMWSDGQTTATASGLAAGSYSVVITDTNGCTTSSNVTLVDPVVLSSLSSVTSNYNGEDVSCYGAADGEASASASGGVAPYGYLWNNGETTAAISGLSAGVYDATITDANGCISSTSVTLSEPVQMSSSTSITSDYNGEEISCYGSADGEAQITANGGITPYTYLWSDGQTTATASSLIAGSYSVTVTDANGCTTNNTIVLNDPTLLQSFANVTSDYNGQDLSCYGVADGQATASATGGTGSYFYSWSNGQNTAVASNLNAGVYTVVVSDINGCLSNTSVTVGQPAMLASSITITSDYNGQDISCYGFTDGEAVVNVTGGTMPYFYSWANGQTNDTATSLNAGPHIVTVTDVNGCVLKDTIVLNEPAQLTSTISVISSYNGEDISCYGDSNGVSQVLPAGGTLPYTYTWSDGQTTNTASGLSVGLYTVQVHDVNGCLNTNSITLSQPTALDISAQIIDVSCNGGNDGEIDITPTGGILPYTYQWSNGAVTQDATNLSADTYTVVLTDDNGCKDTLQNLVVDPTAIDLDIAITNELCKDDSNGAIDLSVSGGTLPYTYSWSSGETTEDITNKPVGSYTVTVTDGNNCFTDISGTITEPDSLLFTYVVTNVLCYGDQNGGIQILPTGGTLPYTYSWSNGDTLQNINEQFAGDYFVSITDSNGCYISDSILITQPDSLWATIASPTYFHGYNVSLYGMDDGSIATEVFGGTEPYMFDWSNGDTYQNIDNLEAGEYILLITDDHGCEYEISMELTQPYDLAMPNGFSPNSDGRNDYFEIRGIDAYPNNEITIFNRWGSIVYQKKGYDNTWNGVSTSGSDLPDGTYFIIVNINKGQEDEIELNNYIDLRR